VDALATVLLRRTGRVTVVGNWATPPDGPGWVAALEADLAGRGWLMRAELREAAARLSPAVRVRWADWLLAVVDETTGADRPMIPLYRSFPDTPRDVEALYVKRLLAHLFAVPGAPCLLCGREEGGEPLDPCGHVVCPACFPPEQYSACPICGRRLAAGNAYLTVVEPPAREPGREPPELPMRLAGMESTPHAAGVRLRDQLVARPHALSEEDRADLRTLIAATAPGDLDWLPETVPARETLALVIADALHAAALTPRYPQVLDTAWLLWATVTDAARTLWAYSGGDPGLVLPGRDDEPGPGEGWRPVDEPPVRVPVTRVRALPRPLRRAVLAHLDAQGAAIAAEELRRHGTVWKRLGERLHPYESVRAFPAAAVAFAALREARTPRSSRLGAAIVAECARSPRHLVLESHPGDRVGVRLRTHASLVEHAFEEGDVPRAAGLLAERPGTFWRALDHLLRAAGDDPVARAAVTAAAAETAGAVAPGVLAAASAEIAGRASTVRATAEHLAATRRARVAAARRKADLGGPTAISAGHLRFPIAGVAGAPRTTTDSGAARIADAFGDADAAGAAGAGGAAGDRGTTADQGATANQGVPVDQGATVDQGVAVDGGAVGEDGVVEGIVGGLPGPGMPRRVFFPRGGVATSWTEPERRPPLPAEAIAALRELVDGELAGRAARQDRFDVAVLDAALAEAPAPMRERAGAAQLAGWPRGTVRPLPDTRTLRLFLHWTEPEGTRVDLDLSCALFDEHWQRVGHCDYTNLRFRGNAAVHSGDLTSAPAPLGATEFLDLRFQHLAIAGARYAVPTVFSYNAVPFEALPEAFAGLMVATSGAGFDPARVIQRYDLHGNTRMHLPLVLDLSGRRLLWTDLALTGRGYGHSVGRHADQLARAAADQWEYFLGGHRTTLFDLMAWHASARCPRVVLAHRDGTYEEVPPSVAAIRAAALNGTGGKPGAPDLGGGRVLAGVTDVAALDRLAAGPGSVALTVTGTPGDPWTPTHPSDLLGELRA